MPIVGSSTPFARLHAAILARVAAAMGVGVEFVRPVANDNYVMTEFENLFAYVRTFGPYPCDPTTGQPFVNDGAGRWRRVVGRRFRVYLYTRSGVDSPGGDEIALQGTDPTQTVLTPPEMPGQFSLEEVVLSALDDYQPTYVNQAGTTLPLSIGPVHFEDSNSGPPVRKPESDDGLVRSHLDFSVCYTLSQLEGEPSPSLGTAPAPGN